MLRLHTQSIARGQRHRKQVLHILEHELDHLLELRVVAHFSNHKKAPRRSRTHLLNFPLVISPLSPPWAQVIPDLPSDMYLHPQPISQSKLPTMPRVYRRTIDVLHLSWWFISSVTMPDTMTNSAASE